MGWRGWRRRRRRCRRRRRGRRLLDVSLAGGGRAESVGFHGVEEGG